MPIDLLHQPPADDAAGIMHVKYLLNDRLVNIQRIHLNTVSEGGVLTAFGDYANVVKNYYSSDWTILLSALDEVFDVTDPVTGLPVRMALSRPCPAADPVPGVSTTVSTAITGLTQTIFTFDLPELDVENVGHKFKLRFVGIAGSAPGISVVVSPTAGGSATDQDLVALVTNAANAFRAHDNNVPLSPARKHTPLDARERRRMMRKK